MDIITHVFHLIFLLFKSKKFLNLDFPCRTTEDLFFLNIQHFTVLFRIIFNGLIPASKHGQSRKRDYIPSPDFVIEI